MILPKTIKNVGVNDHNIDLFEGHYSVPNGISYNSYVIHDEKTIVMDSVGENFAEEWLNNIEKETQGKAPDYIIVQHMEPDHSRNIGLFMDRYPNAKLVASAKAFPMMKAFYGDDYQGRSLIVGDGDSLNIGSRSLSFITAPMVHWPEVIMTYDPKEKVFFSADAFGKFGALDSEDESAWEDEARRYYFGIVGKYGAPVQTVFKKIEGFDIKTICSLHGPVLSENIGKYLDLYNTWSTYDTESDGVAIFYTSVYGHTKEAVAFLVEKLEKTGCAKLAIKDLARCDWSEAVAEAFRYGKVVFATTTYNGDIFPNMRDFISYLKERGWQKRKLAIIENGSWGPVAARKIKESLENSKDIEFLDPVVTIKSAMSEENKKEIEAIAEILK